MISIICIKLIFSVASAKYFKDFITNIFSKFFLLRINGFPGVLPSIPEAASSELTKLLVQNHLELYQIVAWSKKVPGFPDIQPAPQLNMLRGSFTDLYLFRLAYRSAQLEVSKYVLDKTSD